MRPNHAFWVICGLGVWKKESRNGVLLEGSAAVVRRWLYGSMYSVICAGARRTVQSQPALRRTHSQLLQAACRRLKQQ